MLITSKKLYINGLAYALVLGKKFYTQRGTFLIIPIHLMVSILYFITDFIFKLKHSARSFIS
ncbi:hypothetical protein BAZO_07394 [Schinkia azotoformans LMG 9581]|uniref:Uncharacterized protein n=1 Tax=Schinkia azotoformans LMG 9581 TaxID=1131731 RepID=K6D5A8_SCHAZ|nr:hypothetical protein BAZO_07394 [Schinkia azotoformans LMG 9581]